MSLHLHAATECDKALVIADTPVGDIMKLDLFTGHDKFTHFNGATARLLHDNITRKDFIGYRLWMYQDTRMSGRRYRVMLPGRRVCVVLSAAQGSTQSQP